MLAFGAALPAIRKRIEEDLDLPGLPKDKVLAAIVRLLERTCMRIGNDEYVKQNESYGLTTLHDKHVKIEGSKMRFKFRGKSGQAQDIELQDPRLSKIVKRCRDIPGWELFQYFDESGESCRITSTDVNSYIREITGEDFTAKDFRTWGGTGWAALVFEELGPAENATEAKKRVVEAIKSVSSKLGNRPATCKKYYVHPAILEAYEDGSLFEALKSCSGARHEETCVMSVVTNYVKKMSEQQDLTGSLRKSLRRNSRQATRSSA
jgi:DNA topoisomerase-1